MNNSIAWILATLLLTGCVTTALHQPSPQTREAFRHANRGLTLHERGDFAAAGREFALAYRLYAAVDNQQGMITSLINSARILRQTREYAAAERELSTIHQLRLDVGHLAPELLFEEAQLALAMVNLPLARNRIATWLQGREGDAGAAGHNLLAMIARRDGNLAEARQEAVAALSGSSNQQGVEAANARRMLGMLDLQEGDLPSAEEHLTRALAIDRANSAGKKIVKDLLALADVAGLRGDTELQSQFLRHAHEVARAGGDAEIVRENEITPPQADGVSVTLVDSYIAPRGGEFTLNTD